MFYWGQMGLDLWQMTGLVKLTAGADEIWVGPSILGSNFRGKLVGMFSFGVRTRSVELSNLLQDQARLSVGESGI